jgi:hypothetical protein
MHIHCPVAADSGLGCSQMFTTLSRFILLGSYKQTELPVVRKRKRGGCPGWWGTGPCSIWAREGIAEQYRLPLHSTLNTTENLTIRT